MVRCCCCCRFRCCLAAGAPTPLPPSAAAAAPPAAGPPPDARLCSGSGWRLPPAALPAHYPLCSQRLPPAAPLLPAYLLPALCHYAPMALRLSHRLPVPALALGAAGKQPAVAQLGRSTHAGGSAPAACRRRRRCCWLLAPLPAAGCSRSCCCCCCQHCLRCCQQGGSGCRCQEGAQRSLGRELQG